MPCVSPLTGYKKPNGQYTLSLKEGWSDIQITIPCGQCISCRARKAMAWAIRIMDESQFHDKNSFLTLTYDEEHLPKDGSLNVKHFQSFARKMRYQGMPFRYYHVGEYGDKFGRAHYHACIFGQDFSEDRLSVRQSQTGYPQWASPTLAKLWNKGSATISSLVPETALYAAKYIMKKKTGKLAIEEYGNRKPPYTTMSLKPGIGYDWYVNYNKDLFPDDFTIRKGKKFPVPKYYDILLEREDPKAFAEVKAARIRKGNQGNWNADRLWHHEKNLEAKLRMNNE